MTEQTTPLTTALVTVGIDPGPRNTAVCVREAGTSTVLYSSTWRRDDETTPVEWAKEVVALIAAEVLPLFPNRQVGYENVTVPQTHFRGQKSFLNPKHSIHLALIVGALAIVFPDGMVVRPGKNGSQPLDTYPEVLKGRRPKTLPGRNNAGTRDHERSAFDVAGVTEIMLREQKITQK